MRSFGYDPARLDDGTRRLVLITGHRRENFGDGFLNICNGIRDLALKYPDVDFVYPMHLNPNVRRPIAEVFGENTPSNVFFIEPLDYLPFVYMMNRSYIILTDSGGIQEEAPRLANPCWLCARLPNAPRPSKPALSTLSAPIARKLSTPRHRSSTTQLNTPNMPPKPIPTATATHRNVFSNTLLATNTPPNTIQCQQTDRYIHSELRTAFGPD